jgi:hypothetical protein
LTEPQGFVLLDRVGGDAVALTVPEHQHLPGAAVGWFGPSVLRLIESRRVTGFRRLRASRMPGARDAMFVKK